MAVAMLAALLMAGCAPGPTPIPTFGVVLRPLPVSPYADGQTICAGVAHPGPIRLVAFGDQIVGQDVRPKPIEIRWPLGFTAVFGPSFQEVRMSDGRTFARVNEDINTQSGNFNGHVLCYGVDGIDVWPLSSEPGSS